MDLINVNNFSWITWKSSRILQTSLEHLHNDVRQVLGGEVIGPSRKYDRLSETACSHPLKTNKMIFNFLIK